MKIHEIISDVCRAKNDLAALDADESVTVVRFAKCEAAASNLETIVGELLTEAWVPRDPPELLAAIQCTTKSLANGGPPNAPHGTTTPEKVRPGPHAIAIPLALPHKVVCVC